MLFELGEEGVFVHVGVDVVVIVGREQVVDLLAELPCECLVCKV